MKIQRFYLQNKIDDKSIVEIVSSDLVNQLKNVFRLKSNDKVILFDNSGFEYFANIQSFNKDSVSFFIDERRKGIDSDNKSIYLFCSVIKKDKFELIVEKATEIGVSHIIPILSERSEKKGLNIERLKRISIEASEQSGRLYIPEIMNIMSLKEAIEFIKYKENIIPMVFHIDGDMIRDKNNASIAIFIGPEGGWSEGEIALFHNSKIPIYSLGKQILKTETAVIAVLSKIVL